MKKLGIEFTDEWKTDGVALHVGLRIPVDVDEGRQRVVTGRNGVSYVRNNNAFSPIRADHAKFAGSDSGLFHQSCVEKQYEDRDWPDEWKVVGIDPGYIKVGAYTPTV